MMRGSVVLAFALLTSTGCAVRTDLGKDCFLVKRDPSDATGKKALPIKEGEIKPNKDFISFGAVECEDLVCVRDSSYVRPATATDESQALGYCSRPCIVTSTIGCPAADPADDKDPARKLTCRPLILDETTLALICQQDAATCQKYFGDTKSPYFCARGSDTSTDAGTP